MKRRSSFIARMVVGRTSEISEAKGVGDEHKRSDEEGNSIGTLFGGVRDWRCSFEAAKAGCRLPSSLHYPI